MKEEYYICETCGKKWVLKDHYQINCCNPLLPTIVLIEKEQPYMEVSKENWYWCKYHKAVHLTPEFNPQLA